MLSDILIVDDELVKAVPWSGDAKSYDSELYSLGPRDENFLVRNPWISDSKPFYFIDHIPVSKKCIVWTYKNEWVAKYFPVGWNKRRGYLSIEITLPRLWWIKNPAVANIYKFGTAIFKTFVPDPWQSKHELIWYIDPRYSNTKDRIWAFKSVPKDPIDIIDMGDVAPELPDSFDVIFLSYQEPNAEENWQRLLAVCPGAKRIHGVKGIFEAHKAAAHISSTEMFYVVDGDAWVVDGFDFTYKPNLFDREVTYVWKSKNPFNSLNYGYGGVKLFNKFLFQKIKSWKTIDLTTTISKDLKVIDKISVETRFNVDPFSTWRSAFRESVKLSILKDSKRLKNWLTEEASFLEFAREGLMDGVEFAKKNSKNSLHSINDYDWLKKYFESKGRIKW
jgi:hypothetical protein